MDFDEQKKDEPDNFVSDSSTEQNAPTHEEPIKAFPIVGIGASAGGLAAFEALFTHISVDSGMAYVVIQHLSASQKSILPEILQRYTSMPIHEVTDGIEVKPDCVYVIPPGCDLALVDGHLMILKPNSEHPYRLSIDFFFRSLANVRKDRAVGIILSGTASDGSQGVRYIKTEGGLTIAQDPDTAEYGDMPRNAISTQDVDYILPPEKMGELIIKYFNHQPIDVFQGNEDDLAVQGATLQKLYSFLRTKTGHDFSLYKQSTILRRIERRIKVTNVSSLAGYLNFLQQRPAEVDVLFRELLINVTQFFRDPAAFEALVNKVIQPLISLKSDGQAPIRVWIAGCSSGEEAYSVAIVIQEQIEAMKADCRVQIYATDLDEDAINTARRGLYSEVTVENVSEERLQRFFNQEEGGYLIKKSIRDLVVFSTQNLIFDPPFSKLDLLCCRNVLIYLEPELQKQLFPVFHYALNPGGFLFLGNSESIGGFTDLFIAVDRKNKIYRCKDVVTQHRIHTRIRSAIGPTIPANAAPVVHHPMTGGLREWTERALLKYHAPACVIINEKHEILYIHGRTGKYLEPSSGEVNNNLLKMAREGLKADLATLIHAAAVNKEPVTRQGVRVKTNGDYQSINLTVRPVEWEGIGSGLIMIVFEEPWGVQAESAPAIRKQSTKNQRVKELEKELKEKDDYLNSIINELEEANQDLKSVNEELQSSNEEMQSTNEELETSKEELQSINEELSTVNAELQTKNIELTALNNDIYNLLASTDIGTIFLDLDLQLRRYTPAVQGIYSFLPGDIGRPINHFLSSLNYTHLHEDAKQVLSTLAPIIVEAQAKDNIWYLINIKPYRTLENVIDGVVITFVDITKQKQGDELRRLATVIRDANDAITVQDFTGKIQAWNQGATRMYGWSEAEAMTMNALDMVPEYLHEETRLFYRRLSQGENVRSYETKRLTRSGNIVDVWITLSVLFDDQHKPVGVATTERDVTTRVQADQKLHFENRSLKALNAWYERFSEAPRLPLDEICQMLTDDAGYRMAWIGQVENGQNQAILPVAWASIPNSQSLAPKQVQMLAKQSEQVIENALQNQHPVAVRNLHQVPSQKLWHADARKNEYNAYIVLPLMHERGLLGALFIYAADPEAFIEQEIDRLEVLSKRISHKLGPIWKGTKE
jgi:two-component system, chemotaxis family, CheB/CheR fusion protein